MKIKGIGLLLIACLVFSCNQPLTEEELIEKALKIHDKVLTVDTHTDTPFRLTDPNYNMAERHDSRQGGGKVDYVRMKEGGLDAIFFAVYIGQGPRDDASFEKVKGRALTIYDAIHKDIEKHSDLVELALTPDDAYRIEKTGKRAIFIGMENGYPIGKDLSLIEKYKELGCSYITLCHTRNNDICDSSNDRKGPEFNGLSEFGEEVVKEMNRLGIMVDVSHMSDSSFYDVVALSKAPVIASHSSARAVCDNPRNLNDDMLLKLKENGGVIQICILSSYVKAPEPNPERDAALEAVRQKFKNFQDLSKEEMDQARKEWYAVNRQFPQKLANVKDVVDHIDHVVKTIGIDYVGIGTDFDGGGGVEDVFDVSEMPNITIELVRRGYTEKEIRKIWGGNAMRVMREVQKAAEDI